MADRLVVGLSSWIIQDGNYGDFARDTDAAFALEFFASPPLEAFEPPSALFPSLTYIGDAIHEVVAHVVHVAEDWWVVDVGFLAFREEAPPANVRRGNWLRGKAYIGIDPFFYFERLVHQPGAPALIYDWKIEKIDIQTAPWIEVRPRTFERDPAKLGWKEIDRTNAWEDDGEYILHCVRVGGPRLPRSKPEP